MTRVRQSLYVTVRITLEDKEVYLEVPNDSNALVSTIFKSLKKNKETSGFITDTLNIS